MDALYILADFSFLNDWKGPEFQQGILKKFWKFFIRIKREVGISGFDCWQVPESAYVNWDQKRNLLQVYDTREALPESANIGEPKEGCQLQCIQLPFTEN